VRRLQEWAEEWKPAIWIMWAGATLSWLVNDLLLVGP
jgi:hypothetical protein